MGAAREPRAPKVCWKHCLHPHPPREAGPLAARVRLIKNLQTGHSPWKRVQEFSIPHLQKQNRPLSSAGRMSDPACVHSHNRIEDMLARNRHLLTHSGVRPGAVPRTRRSISLPRSAEPESDRSHRGGQMETHGSRQDEPGLEHRAAAGSPVSCLFGQTKEPLTASATPQLLVRTGALACGTVDESAVAVERPTLRSSHETGLGPIHSAPPVPTRHAAKREPGQGQQKPPARCAHQGQEPVKPRTESNEARGGVSQVSYTRDAPYPLGLMLQGEDESGAGKDADQEAYGDLQQFADQISLDFSSGDDQAAAGGLMKVGRQGGRRAELKNYELTPPMQAQERRGRRLTSADLESFAETTEAPHEAGERGERLAGRQGRRPGQLEEERGAAAVPHLEQGNQWMRMLARTPARLFPSPSGRYHL